jgi:hypothetical protein
VVMGGCEIGFGGIGGWFGSSVGGDGCVVRRG